MVRTVKKFVTRAHRGAVAALMVAAAGAHAQVFLQVDGFTIGNGSGTVQTPTGPASDSANIHNMFFPSAGTDTANIAVASRGNGYAQITVEGAFDGSTIRLQGFVQPQCSSLCDQDGCGNGAASADITSRASFRVSQEAVLFLSGGMTVTSHTDFGVGGSGTASAASTMVVTGAGVGTLFGRTISNSSNSSSTQNFIDSGVARIFPGIDYTFTITCSGGAQSFGPNAGADCSARAISSIRLRPAACPTASAPSDVVHCSSLAGSPAMFNTIISGTLPRTVRWQFFDGSNWINLTDGAFAGVGVVSGSSTDALTISGPGIAPHSFRASVINDCGAAFSAPAALHICASDFNCDGAVDFFDYLDFIDAFASGDPVADFNHDSVIDLFDYLDFVDVFSTGC